jgi:hypothetical protein
MVTKPAKPEYEQKKPNPTNKTNKTVAALEKVALEQTLFEKMKEW